MGNLHGWKMVRKDSGGEVLPGTTQLDFRGNECTVHGVSRAPNGRSTGRVARTDSQGRTTECYPDVFGLTIVPDDTEPTVVAHIPDTVEELLGEDGSVRTHARLPHGIDGVAMILAEVGERRAIELPNAISEAIAKAYAFGYLEASAGRESALNMVGYFLPGDDPQVDGN